MKGHPVFAALYDRLSAAGERRGMREQRERLLAGAVGRVLEVGAGTGLNFAHYPPAVTEVVATDPDPHMLRRAQAAVGSARVPVRLEATSAEALPVEDGSFDTAVATLVLCSVDDPARALREIRRALRPGGRLLFLEHVRSEDRRVARWQDLLERPWGWFAAGCHPNRDTLAAIRSAGFELEDVERFSFGPAVAVVAPHAAGVARAPGERMPR